MGKARGSHGRAAHYRLQAALARNEAVTLTDAHAREIMLEVAKTLDGLAEVEESMSGQAPADEDQ